MRAIFLNCWQDGRHLWKEITSYLLEESEKTDIFALSEAGDKLFDFFKENLPDFQRFYTMDKSLDNSLDSSLMLVGKNIEVVEYNKLLLYETDESRMIPPGFVHAADLKMGEKVVRVGSVQGTALPGDKNDTPERIKQSEDTLKTMGTGENRILGGDFNLNPDTKSIKMFEDAGYRNLIKEFDIKNTRNEYAFKQARELAEKGEVEFHGEQPFADYCFVTPSIKVKSFEVPALEISDHLPLVLEFEFED